MADFLENFEEKSRAIAKYLNMLASIETQRTKLKGNKQDAESNFLVMKATVFLLIYNLVESSVKSGFQEVYDDLTAKAISFNGSSDEIKDIWLKQRIGKVPSTSANQDTYLAFVRDIANIVSEESALDLSARYLTVSGNLDAQKIRKLCKDHGFSPKIHYRAFGGGELGTVKTKRNNLAHGHLSFDECGREYTVSDLRRIHIQVCVFIRGFLKSLAKSLEKSIYVA